MNKITVEDYFQSKSEPSNKRFHNLRYVEKIADNIGSLTHNQSRGAESTNDVSAIKYTVADLYSFVKRFDKGFTAGKSVSPAMLNDDGTPKV